MGLEVGLGSPDVLPVAAHRGGVDPPAADQRGQEVVAEVAEAGVVIVVRGGLEPGAQLLELGQQGRRVVEEDLGGDGARLRGGRLGAHRADEARVVVLDHHLVHRLLHPDLGGDDRALRLAVEVGGDDRAQVEVEDVVGRHDDQHVRVGDPDRLAHPEETVGVAVAEAVLVGRPRPLLGGETAESAAGPVEVPRAAAREVAVEGAGLELYGDPDVAHPGSRQDREREVHERVARGEGEGGFGPLPGQHVHPAALTTGLHDGQGAEVGNHRHGSYGSADPGAAPTGRPEAVSPAVTPSDVPPGGGRTALSQLPLRNCDPSDLSVGTVARLFFPLVASRWAGSCWSQGLPVRGAGVSMGWGWVGFPEAWR